MKITILGSGSAAGTPNVSGGWGRCDAANPRNRRRRSSILVEEGATAVLVDTSPDLREQMLDTGIRHLDGVIYTHGHADHIHGIDELREINRISKAPLPIYGTAGTLDTLATRFGYVFRGALPGEPILRPWLSPQAITPAQSFTIGSLAINPFLQGHGAGSTTLGLAFGDVVYSTDVIELPEAAKPIIRGAKVWILGVLSDVPYPTHVHLAMALDWIAELRPRTAVITHMSNALDYATLAASLPPGVVPAYDGMVITP